MIVWTFFLGWFQRMDSCMHRWYEFSWFFRVHHHHVRIRSDYSDTLEGRQRYVPPYSSVIYFRVLGYPYCHVSRPHEKYTYDWNTDFVTLHPQYLAQDNALGFLTEDGGDTYNLCHCKSFLVSSSKFEIRTRRWWAVGSLEQLRDRRYGFLARRSLHCILWLPRFARRILLWGSSQAYLLILLSRPYFYWPIVPTIQRWGDAPVHSIAAALFAPKNQLHFFNEIGYEHAPYTHCPRGEKAWTKGRCGCDPNHNFGALFDSVLVEIESLCCWYWRAIDYDGYSCMTKWDRLVKS